MEIHMFSEAAAGHANEDAFSHRQHPLDRSVELFALADGQGGQAGGFQAASTAVLSVLDAASLLPPEKLLDPGTWETLGHIADDQVAKAFDAGYCSLVALVVTGEWVVGASAGDSMAILLLDDITSILTESQWKNPPIGSGSANIWPFSAMLDGKWLLLILSDGVWKFIEWDRLISIARDTPRPEIVTELRREVIDSSQSGLPDDFSIVVVTS